MTYVLIEPAATRLGNWMFQYAAAKREDDEVIFVVPDDQYRWAESIRRCAFLFGAAPIVKLSELPMGAQVRRGLYQDVKYVDREQCRKLFACPKDIQLFLFGKYGDVLNDDRTVSINVRRGDYMRLPHRHPFVGTSYLRNAVSLFSRPGVRFLICSDDIPWCQKFFRGPQFVFTEGNGWAYDLFAMAMCRGGHICSNSSFSWWGAFLGEGRVVFPSMWYGIALNNVDCKGLYFDGSEVLHNRYSVVLFVRACFFVFRGWVGWVLRKVGIR